MEIYLKMSSQEVIEKDNELKINYFDVSQACGYSFDTLDTVSSKQTEEEKSTFISRDTEVQEILQKMIDAYNGHRIDEAYKYREQYLKLVKQIGCQIITKYKALIQTIKQQMEDVWEYEKQLGKQGWVHKKDGSFYKIYTKHFDQTVAVLVEADLEIPIQKFIFVLNEFDLMKKFMPFMQQSKEVKQISRNCKIGHIVNNFPIISKRQAFFQGIGYDRMKHNNTILLFSRSLHNRKDIQQKLGYKVKLDEDAVQLEYKFFLVQYKPINRHKGKIRIGMNVDMKIAAPKFLLDPLSQNFGRDFLKNVLHVTHNFEGSEWQKSASQKTQFTNFIRQTINKYFPQ